MGRQNVGVSGLRRESPTWRRHRIFDEMEETPFHGRENFADVHAVHPRLIAEAGELRPGIGQLWGRLELRASGLRCTQASMFRRKHVKDGAPPLWPPPVRRN